MYLILPLSPFLLLIVTITIATTIRGFITYWLLCFLCLLLCVLIFLTSGGHAAFSPPLRFWSKLAFGSKRAITNTISIVARDPICYDFRSRPPFLHFQSLSISPLPAFAHVPLWLFVSLHTHAPIYVHISRHFMFTFHADIPRNFQDFLDMSRKFPENSKNFR